MQGKTRKRMIIWCVVIVLFCGILYRTSPWGIANSKCKEIAVDFVEQCVDILEENFYDCGIKDMRITYVKVPKIIYSIYQDPLNKAKDYQYFFLLNYHCDVIAELYQISIENGAEEIFARMMRKLLDIHKDLLRQIRNQGGPYECKGKTMEVNVGERMKRDSLLLKTSTGETYQVFSEEGNYWIEVNGKRIEKMDYKAPYFDPNSGYTPSLDKHKEKDDVQSIPNENEEQYSHGAITPSDPSDPSDPYDVEDYDKADDFADEWADEFADSYNGDYDDGYDDAYDYWEEEYEY